MCKVEVKETWTEFYRISTHNRNVLKELLLCPTNLKLDFCNICVVDEKHASGLKKVQTSMQLHTRDSAEISQ
jgi:hypothetical protein